MKNKILSFILFLLLSITSNIYSQTKIIGCFTDEYNNYLNQNDPIRVEEINLKMDLSKKSTTKKNHLSNKTIIIPVVFHIVHNGEPIGNKENPREGVILEQLQILNDAFADKKIGGNGSADTQIRFCLAKRNSQGISKNGIIRYKSNREKFVITRGLNDTNEDRILKSQHKAPFFPSYKYLNIWVANVVTEIVPNGDLISDLHGYSTFPWEVDSVLDGVVINYKFFGKNPLSTKFGLGKTLIHEVGHWLGLYHTFRDGDKNFCFENDCSSDGDKVCDTEPRDTPAWSGIIYPSIDDVTEYNCYYLRSCVDAPELTNSVQNYMDYNFDPCSRFFTEGQGDRMKDELYWYRNDIYNENDPPTGCTTGIEDGDDGDPSYGDGSTEDIGEGFHSFSTFHETGANTIFNDNWMFITHGKEINIKKRIGCESEYHQIIVVNYESIQSFDSGYDDSTITIIDNNTFAIVASNNINNGRNHSQRDLLIYKNINNNWQLYQTISLGNSVLNVLRTSISYNAGVLAVMTRIVNVGVVVSALNFADGYYRNFATFFVNKNNRSIQVDMYGNIYTYDLRYSNTRPEKVHYYRYNSIKREYLLAHSFDLGGSSEHKNVTKWITRNGKLYVWIRRSYYSKQRSEELNYIIVFEKVRPYPNDYNLSNTAWEETEEYEVNFGHPHKTYNFEVYDNVFIFAVQKRNHHSLRFLTKTSEGRTPMSISPLGENTRYLRKPCKAKYYNWGKQMKINSNELLVSGRVLYKIPQILGEAPTSQICRIPKAIETFGHTISIGGDCSVNISNSINTITASSGIILKKGTIISNSIFIAKIRTNLSSQCNIINVGNKYDCNVNKTVAKKHNYSKLTLEKTDKKQIKVFPNPNKGIFYIDYVQQIEKVQLFNMMGQLIFDKKMNSNNTIVVPNIKNGLYNLILYKKNGKENESIKVIINK